MKKWKFKTIKKVVILLLIILLSTINDTTVCFAAESLDSVITGAQSFVTGGKKQGQIINEVDIQTASNLIINVLMTIGTMIAAIVILILGIKYMVTPIAEKAETKQAMMPFIIGCFVMFGAFSIWKIVVNILQSVE